MTTISILFDNTKGPGQQFSFQTTGGSNAKNVTFSATETINWTINSNSVPYNVQFNTSSAKPGIVFGKTNTTPSEWPNSQPTGNATQWSVNDIVAANTKGKFAYTINLVTPGGTIYSTDPDVTNSPPPG